MCIMAHCVAPRLYTQGWISDFRDNKQKTFSRADPEGDTKAATKSIV